MEEGVGIEGSVDSGDTDHAGDSRYLPDRNADIDMVGPGDFVCTDADIVIVDDSNAVLGIGFFAIMIFPFLSTTLYIPYIPV